jgi:hypothetical protein
MGLDDTSRMALQLCHAHVHFQLNLTSRYGGVVQATRTMRLYSSS